MTLRDAGMDGAREGCFYLIVYGTLIGAIACVVLFGLALGAFIP